jgi:hypothetical protein
VRNSHEANPFEVLRLDPTTPDGQVVAQAGALRQRATDEETVTAIRQAVQALTGRPEERILFQWLTHPNPCYQARSLERLAAAFRRAPPSTAAPPSCPPLDLVEFAALLRPLAAEEWALSPLPLEPVGGDEPPEEIQRQIVEALWQSLLHDNRG